MNLFMNLICAGLSFKIRINTNYPHVCWFCRQEVKLASYVMEVLNLIMGYEIAANRMFLNKKT